METDLVFVEFVGMVGAGKTTFVDVLERQMREHAFEVLSLDRALRRCSDRSHIGTVITVLAGGSPLAQTILHLYRRVIGLVYTLLFMIENPHLSLHVSRSQLHRTIPWWHRRIILRLFFGVAADYWYLRHRLNSNEVVILDEGLLHRAINLYAWEPRHLSRDTMMTYLALLPVLDLAVLAKAPLNMCFERATRRGLPIRLRDKDARTVSTFMQQSALIVESIEDYLATTPRHSIVVDNSGSIDSGVASLISGIHAYLQGSSASGSQAHNPAVFSTTIGESR